MALIELKNIERSFELGDATVHRAKTAKTAKTRTIGVRPLLLQRVRPMLECKTSFYSRVFPTGSNY